MIIIRCKSFQSLGGAALALLSGAMLVATAGMAAEKPRSTRQSGEVDAAARAHVVRTSRLAGAKTWAYQLQNADPATIARSSYDMVVVDHTKNGNPGRTLTTADIARMKKKPDGGRRIVLAYVSVGEAEDYRFYWDSRWIETAPPAPSPTAVTPSAGPAATGADLRPAAGAASPSSSAPRPTEATRGAQVPTATVQPSRPPAGEPNRPLPQPDATPATGPTRWISALAPPWLGDENETWSGNFAVRYWDKGWQDLIVGAPGSFVDRVLALGFDGVYLDRVDAYYEHIDDRPSAAEDMVDFVVRLASEARKTRPDAIVVPQNGEELLTRPAYVAAIDGIAKEDLLYGSPVEGQPNSPAQIANSLTWLSHATAAGQPVFVIEYLDDPRLMASAHTELKQSGFIPYYGPRGLDRLSAPFTDQAAGATGAAPADKREPATRQPTDPKKPKR